MPHWSKLYCQVWGNCMFTELPFASHLGVPRKPSKYGKLLNTVSVETAANKRVWQKLTLDGRRISFNCVCTPTLVV